MAGSHTGAVARIWRGRTKPGRADEYATYLYQHGVKKLESLGARAVQMFRQDLGEESEFMVVSYWDTLSAMTRWAGDDPTRIRHLERDADFLVELPAGVQILNVLSNNWFLSDTMRQSA
jgi:heme-degrading monooxygenase HmoA